MSVYSGVPGAKSILTYLHANDFLFAFAVEANTSVINVNDLIFGNVRETETEGNDIIVSSSNNKQYSVPVLSLQNRDKNRLKTQAQLFRPADTA